MSQHFLLKKAAHEIKTYQENKYPAHIDDISLFLNDGKSMYYALSIN